MSIHSSNTSSLTFTPSGVEYIVWAVFQADYSSNSDRNSTYAIRKDGVTVNSWVNQNTDQDFIVPLIAFDDSLATSSVTWSVACTGGDCPNITNPRIIVFEEVPSEGGGGGTSTTTIEGVVYVQNDGSMLFAGVLLFLATMWGVMTYFRGKK